MKFFPIALCSYLIYAASSVYAEAVAAQSALNEVDAVVFAKAASPNGFVAAGIFNGLAGIYRRIGVGRQKEAVNYAKACVNFVIKKNGKTRVWNVNLKTGLGSMQEISKPTSTCPVAEISDADFVLLMQNRLKPVVVIAQGRLKINGDIWAVGRVANIARSLRRVQGRLQARLPWIMDTSAASYLNPLTVITSAVAGILCVLVFA